MRIVTSATTEEFFRRPRSKRRRIVNKWRKRPENRRPSAFFSATLDTLIIHPTLFEQVRYAECREPRDAASQRGGGLTTADIDRLLGLYGAPSKAQPYTQSYIDVNYTPYSATQER